MHWEKNECIAVRTPLVRTLLVWTLVQLITKESKCTYLLRAFFLLDSRLGLLLIDLVRFHLMQQISGAKNLY